MDVTYSPEAVDGELPASDLDIHMYHRSRRSTITQRLSPMFLQIAPLIPVSTAPFI